MSVASATAAASTRHRRDSRASNPGKVRESITPKMSHVEGLEEFQRSNCRNKPDVNDLVEWRRMEPRDLPSLN
uniref:Uncharacterized protein n=1 Tax=Magallana gigas TaxID=29159 RepID=K1PVK9_MAGGI